MPQAPVFLEFDSNGTYGTAPMASTAARFLRERYGLSAETSVALKPFAAVAR